MFCHDEPNCVRAYHWNLFGSTEGFAFELPHFMANTSVVTSFEQRNNIHLLAFDPNDNACYSMVLDITCPATEFMFRERRSKALGKGGNRPSAHNCLIDCHSDVWTRFPVVPAIRRQTIISGEGRKSKFILFITGRDHGAFKPYFKELIQSFERSTRKPTETRLSGIEVKVEVFSSLIEEMAVQSDWHDISSLKAGEWVVDLLCLIPIHIAIARDNRFIPLKDGVWTSTLEKSLLGAEVGQIVDSISFGWYESIFQSYMSTKVGEAHVSCPLGANKKT